MSVFEARLEKDDALNVCVLTIEGDFTLDETGKVDPLVADAVASPGRGTVLDLSRLRLMDSAGMMVVLGLHNRLTSSGKAMSVVTADNAYAKQRLSELGLLRIPRLEAFETSEEAKRTIAHARA